MSGIMTVEGPRCSSALGVTLPHEHLLVDWVGAEKTSKDRYNAGEVFEFVLPYLKQVRELGCRSLVECTSAYLGRDVEVLRRLAKASGVQILTNTGYYGSADDRFVPAHAYTKTVEQLAQRWIREWEQGIDGTDVRPGFIKTGLSQIGQRLVPALGAPRLLPLLV